MVSENGGKLYNYKFTNTAWKDQLTAIGSRAFTYDAIGNTLTDGKRTFTWKHGRQLATLTKGETTWTNTYNADGLRIKRTDGTNTYQYHYADGELISMSYNGSNLYFAYTPDGLPYNVEYGGTQYVYALNLQGDVMAILNTSGAKVVEYTYDAWGNILSVTGSMADTLGQINPLRYRGYVYDNETALYYLQSRYYDPEIGRFINADSQINDDILGNNLYAYCGNNPVDRADDSGKGWWVVAGAVVGGIFGGITKVATNISTGQKWNKGVVGAVVGGAVYGGILAATGNVVAASFAGAAADALVNEAISYTPLANYNGAAKKKVTTENIITSTATVAAETVVNGIASAITGKVAGKLVPTNNGWFKPQSVTSSFFGKYAIKSGLQTAAQSALLYGANVLKSLMGKATQQIPVVDIVPKNGIVAGGG